MVVLARGVAVFLCARYPCTHAAVLGAPLPNEEVQTCKVLRTYLKAKAKILT